MPTEILFWYTGWAVWAIISLIVFIVSLIAGIAAVCKCWYYIKNWMKLHHLLMESKVERISEAYRNACFDVGTPFKDDPDKGTKWLFSMSKHYNKLNGAGTAESNHKDQGADSK